MFDSERGEGLLPDRHRLELEAIFHNLDDKKTAIAMSSSQGTFIGALRVDGISCFLSTARKMFEVTSLDNSSGVSSCGMANLK